MRIKKTSYWYFMVDCTCFFATHLAFIFRQFSRQFTSSAPSTTPGVCSSACPSWMVCLPNVFGLPFRHTFIITECFYSVKIGLGAVNSIAAIITYFCGTIRSFWVGLTGSSLYGAFKRAINLISFACAICWFSANSAYRRNAIFSPSARKIAFSRTEMLIWPTIQRVKFIAAFLAYTLLCKFLHVIIITQYSLLSRIEEKYCEIAANRLRQEVLL